MEYSAYIITNKSANTLTKKNDFYIEALKAILPELFPIDLTQDSDGNFVEVTGNRGKSNKPKPFGPEEPPQQLSLNQSIALIKSSSVVSEITSNTRWVCTKGRGGNRAVGVYDNYYAKHNARYLSQGISGGSVLRADNDAEGWSLVNIRIPGVDSPAKLRIFHMCIPHTETNLTPSYSDYDGETFHRHGAIAYTFCENDDQEMLESRMAMTLQLTGSYDGVIDRREYYHAYMAEFRARLAALNPPPPNTMILPHMSRWTKTPRMMILSPTHRKTTLQHPANLMMTAVLISIAHHKKSAKFLIPLQPRQQLRQSLLLHMRIYPNPPSTLLWHYLSSARSPM
jgi:hypothetical protein